MHAEEESLSGQRLSKDHSWRIVEISCVLESESLKKKITHPLHHHMLFGRVSRRILLAHPKTNSSKFRSLMLRACFSAGSPEHLVQMHGIMDSIKYQQIKNQNLTASVRNLIMGRVWIFHQDNNPKQTSK